MDSEVSRCCHVVAVPYPGRGHINPMMNLCRLLASKNLLITFVVTEEWLGLLRADHSVPPPPPNVHLRSIPNVIPSEVGRAKDFSGFLDAVYTKMEEPFERLFDRLELPVKGIVADIYLPWAVAVGNRRNIPAYSLFTMAASFFSALCHFDLLPGSDNEHVALNPKEVGELLGKYIPGHNSIQLADLGSVLASDKLRKRALEAFFWVRKAQSVLFTSFYELEDKVIDALRANLPCPVYPLGPSIPYMMLQEKPMEQPNGSNSYYYEWLNSRPKHSVLYVSLGSFLSVSGQQMDEIALGLGLSGTRFLWVARGDSSRLQEMVGAMGLLVPWCDQLRVLNHPSVGGFLTHCGWNSILEGVFAGVPMLTFPIFWDQPLDSRLIVDDWKVGLSLKGEVGRESIVGREEIARVVKRLMDLDGNDSKEMRRRSAELQDVARGAIEEGGSSYENLNSFVEIIMQGIGC